MPLMERTALLPRCLMLKGEGSFLVSAEYRRYAQACLEIAEAVGDQRTRALFIQMAQVWFRLAEEHPVQSESPLEQAD